MNTNESTTRYDDQFRAIAGLKWLPWVGQHFSERPPHQRLLVVGESHYYIGNTPEERQASRDSYADTTFTRAVVSESLIDGDWTTKTLTNIPKLLFKTTQIDRTRLWADSGYYNFVQLPMFHNKGGQSERPTWDDFVAGWKVFADFVSIIQPSHCLFIGVTAANCFDYSMENQKLPHEKVSCAPAVGGVCPRVAKLEMVGKSIKLIFVHHLGRCRNLSQWHDYLQTQHADLMNWFSAESYTVIRTD